MVTRPSAPLGVGIVCRRARMTPRPNSSFSPDRVTPGGRITAAERPPGAIIAPGKSSCSGGLGSGGGLGLAFAGGGVFSFTVGVGGESGLGFSTSIGGAAAVCGSTARGGEGAAAGGGGGGPRRRPDRPGDGSEADATVDLLRKSAASTSSTLMPLELPSGSPTRRSDDVAIPTMRAACNTAAHVTPIQNSAALRFQGRRPPPRGHRQTFGRSRDCPSAPISPARSDRPPLGMRGARLGHVPGLLPWERMGEPLRTGSSAMGPAQRMPPVVTSLNSMPADFLGREVDVDVVAVGVPDVDLHGARARHFARLVPHLVALETTQELLQAGCGEGEVLELQQSFGLRQLVDSDQVHGGFAAAVEPGAGERERRAVARRMPSTRPYHSTMPAPPSPDRPTDLGVVDQIPTLRELAGFEEEWVPAIEDRPGSEAAPGKNEWLGELRRASRKRQPPRPRADGARSRAWRSSWRTDPNGHYDFLFDEARHLLAIGSSSASSSVR